MAATIPQIREAIADQLSGITGVRWYSRYEGQIIAPAGVVRRQLTTYGVDFNGSDDHVFAVSLYMPLGDQSSAQDLLDELLSTSGTRSVKAALEASPTMGGVVQWSNVERVIEEGAVSMSGVDYYLSATITISIGAA